MDITWLISFAESWRDRVAHGRVPHALMLVGPVGVGKRAAARWLASTTLGMANDRGQSDAALQIVLVTDLQQGSQLDGRGRGRRDTNVCSTPVSTSMNFQIQLQCNEKGGISCPAARSRHLARYFQLQKTTTRIAFVYVAEEK